MSKIEDGGNAFPVNDPFHLEPGDVQNMKRIAKGMSLRDYFAAKALHTVVGYSAEDLATWSTDDFAKHAYAIADAMIRART